MRETGVIETLAPYFDLHSPIGPTHARIVAETGRCFLSGTPILAYQCHTPALLRLSISQEWPTAQHIGNPFDLPFHCRTAEWNFLCDQLSRWHEIDEDGQVAAMQVLHRLGFWEAAATYGGNVRPDSKQYPELTRLRRVALCRILNLDPSVDPETYRYMASVATDPAERADVRIRAFTNLVVHHGRSDRDVDVMQHWYDKSRQVMEVAGPSLSPILLSFYWRGMSFIPFFQKDHSEVAVMLNLAEAYSRAAVRTSSDGEQLLARDNLYPLLETRARAAIGAGNLDDAESCYRALVDLEPLDGRTHVKLGEFLKGAGRLREALQSYESAEALGPPCVQYARSQVQALSSM